MDHPMALLQRLRGTKVSNLNDFALFFLPLEFWRLNLTIRCHKTILWKHLHHQPKIKERFPGFRLILFLSLGFRIRQRVELPPLGIVGANGLQIGIKLDLRCHTGQNPRISFLW
jgi:hypothetical protein